jgi:signal transduction histidine kinase
MRELEIRSAAAGPIILGGRIWGALLATWPKGTPMPAGAEHRVAAFAELVSYAIENAETREKLAASRARIVEAADEARRRIERDLHDGAQQRLVAAALELTLLERRLEHDPDEARSVLAKAREHLDGSLAELRDLARGIHPAVLSERGLEAALDALAQRAPVPVELRVVLPERLDATIEAAAYFLVSEALTNVAKYAQPPRSAWMWPRPAVRWSSRSPTTASAAPTPSAAQAFAAWSIASTRSVATWRSAARSERGRNYARSSRRPYWAP